MHYPELLHGVIALVPSDAVVCSYPGCTGPAWTLGGHAVPFTRDFDDPRPLDNPAAVIPVEQIRGPVFLDCGGADQIWVSCDYARAIVSRLRAHHVQYRHVLYSYPGASHGVGQFVPYEPSADLADPSFAIDQQDRVSLYERLLASLARCESPRDAHNLPSCPA